MLPPKTNESILTEKVAGDIPIALIFPNEYGAAIANLGFNAMYKSLLRAGFLCERFVYSKEGISRSLESNRKITDFGVWAFSISFEWDLLNVVETFKKSNVNPFSAERNGYPFVVFGGAMTFFNPNSFWFMADAIFHGEIEGSDFLEVLHDALSKGVGKERLFEVLGGLPNVSIPSFGVGKVQISRLQDMSSSRAESVMLSEKGAFGKRYLVEIERGCVHGCRFCVAGYVYRKARFMPLRDVKAKLSKALRYTDSVGLVAATVSDYPYLDELLDWLVGRVKSLSVSSLRLDAITPKLIKTLNILGDREITLAPEAGSQRMRDLINKKITEDDFDRALGYVKDSGLKRVKLYFIYGLPYEEEKDLDGIIYMVQTVKKRGIIPYVSLNPFIPKPWTPFEDFQMVGEKELKNRRRYLEAQFGKMKIRSKFESVRLSRLQWVISTADVELSKGMLTSAEPLKFLKGLEGEWKSSATWKYIDVMKESFLEGQKKMAVDFITYPDCKIDECKACGVCQKIKVQGGIKNV